MIKKFRSTIALVLALLCVLSVAACSGGSDDTSKDATDVMNQSGDLLSAEEGSDSADSVDAESKDDTNSTDDSSAADDSSQPDDTSKGDEYTDTDADGNAKRDPNYKCLNYDTMKGIWISQFDIPSVFNAANEKAFKSSVKRIVKAISETGFNTIVLQVRPNGDSFYPSKVYPASEFVVGAYGKDFRYDPIKIFVKTAHEYGLSFHAWINPMRLMSTTDITKISTDYRIGQWYEEKAPWMVAEGNNYYLVPGYDESRQLVCDGITELISNYNIDAVHIDDYFYPTMKESFDNAHFKPVEEDYVSRKEYRLEMVDKLVNQMYKTVKAACPEMPFGISPAGSIQNNLNSLYANVRKWCSTPGFCDYIAPQVYWGFEHPKDAQKFDLCCKEWEALCTSDSVKLVIGIGIYRAKNPNPSEFQEYIDNKDVTKRQLEFLQTMDKNSGFIMYSYPNLFTVTGKYQNYFAEERENMLPVLKEFGEK